VKKGKDLDTSFSISSAFAELIEKDSYSNISIDNICKTANVSKKTFYRYYDNKEALVREIIRNDFVYPVISLREILPVSEIKSSTVLMLERHYQAMEKHRDFYRGLMEAQGWSWLADIMIDEMHQLQKKLYHAPDFARYNFDEAELDYISYLFSAASVMISLWWIRSDTDIDSKRLTKLDDTWRFAHWRE
jgi:AcrR family transcriptional regulator